MLEFEIKLQIGGQIIILYASAKYIRAVFFLPMFVRNRDEFKNNWRHISVLRVSLFSTVIFFLLVCSSLEEVANFVD